MKTLRRSISHLAALATLVALPLHSPAADFTWNGGGGDGNLSTGLNWVGGSPAVSDLINTNLIFGGTLQLAPNLDSAFSTKGLTFDSTAGAFSFTGSTLSLGTSGIVNNSTNTMTFGNAVNFGGAFSSTINAASGGLTFNNTVTMPITTLTVMGAATTMLSGASASLAVGAQTLQLNSDFKVDAGAQLTRASGGAVTLAAGKTLTLQNGGDATFTGGYTATAASTITVTGAGSTLNTTTASLNVYAGSTLNVLGGGDVTISGGNLNLADTIGGGTLLVDGAGSTATATTGGLFVGFSGNAGNATFSNQAVGSFNAIGVSDSVAAGSSGILNIQSGATITGTKLDMAPNAVVNAGTLTISGTGSALTLTGSSASTIGAASASTAIINIQTGGTFSTNSGTTTVNATGTVNLAGGTLNVKGIFDNNGTFNFTSGTLDVKTGGNFQSGTSTITAPTGATIAINGGTYTSEGDLTIDGGTLNRNSGTFTLATGKTLTVQNGGIVNLFNGGGNNGSFVVVTGTGSQLNVIGSGSGGMSKIEGGSTFNVLNGGAVSVPVQFTLADVTGSGSLLVDGAGSTLTSAYIRIGNGGGAGTATFSNSGVGTFNAVGIADSGFPGTQGTLNINTGGTVTGTSLAIAQNSVANTGTLNITGAGSVLTLTGTSASTIGAANASTATLNIQSGGTFSTNTGTTTLNPTGTVNLAGGTLNVKGVFDNNGAFNFTGGTLDVKTGGSFQSGMSTITVPTGATLAINGGTYTSEGNLTVDGGQMNRNSGTFSLAASKTLSVQNGGSVNLTGSFTHNTQSTITVTGAGSSFVTTGTLGLGGFGTVNVLNGGSLQSLSNIAAFSPTILVDGSGSNFTGTSMFIGSGSLTFANNATGSFNSGFAVNSGVVGAVADVSIQSGGQLSAGNLTMATSEAAANTDTLTITGAGSALNLSGASASTIGAASASTATLNIQSGGTFNTNTGTLNLNPTGTINLTGGTFTQNGPLNRAGGAFNFTSGTFNANVPFVAGASGALGSSVMLASGQTLNAASTVTIDSGSTLAISGGTFSAQDNLTVNGSLTRDASSAFSVAAGKTMTVQGGGSASFTGAFNHNTASTITITDAGSTLSTTGALSLTGGSTTNVLAGGSLSSGTTATLASGSSLNLDTSTATFTGGLTSSGAVGVTGGMSTFNGTLAHSGSFTVGTGATAVFNGAVSGPGNFSGAGTVDFRGGYSPGSSPGIVTIAGDAIFAPTNTLTMEIGGLTPGTQHDQIQVGGNTTLGGAVNLAFTNNSFFPQSGNSFVIMDTAGTFTNTATFTPSGLRSGWQFGTTYNAGTGELTVTSLSKGIPLAAPTTNAVWNSSSGNWNDATKWSSNPNFPLNGNGGSVYNATQNGGTITLNQNIDIDSFTKNGGVLNGSSSLTLSGLLTFTAGGMDGLGAIHANGGVQFSTGNLKNIYNRTVNIGANSNWTGGILGLVGSNVVVQSGATFTTDFDGTMDSNIIAGTGNFTVNAGGTFTKSDGSGATIIGTGSGGANGFNVAEVTYNNHGTTNVNSGTLSLIGGGNSTGAFNVAAGKTLSFGGIISGSGNIHVHDLSGSASVNAANATVVFAGGYTNLGATTTYTVGTTLVNGGEAYFNNASNTGTLTLSAGAVTGTGSITASGLTTFTGGTMKGTGTTVANGGAALSGGTLNVNGGRNFNIGGTGVSTWNSGTLAITTGGTVRVLNGATLDLGFDGTADSNSIASTGHFTVDAGGTFTKSAGTGTATIGTGSGGANGLDVAEVTFNNNGVTNVNSGTLSLIGGGTSTGAFNVATGATLRFGGGTFGSGTHNHNLNAGASVQGAGTILFAGAFDNLAAGTTYNVGATQVAGGVASFNGTASTGVLSVSSGSLGGSGTFSVSGMTTFTGGTMTGTGTTLANGGATLSGGTLNVNGGRNFNIGGTGVSTWNSGTLAITTGGTVRVLNGATLDLGFDGTADSNSIASTGHFTVDAGGTFTKSAGTGTATIGTGSGGANGLDVAEVTFNNNGVTNVNSGTLSLIGGGTSTGAFNVASGATLRFGGGTFGSGTHNHNLNAGASVQGAGTILFAGAFDNLAAGTTYNVGATQVAGGVASFNGTASTRVLTYSSGAVTVGGSLTVGDGSTSLNSTWSGGGITLQSAGSLTNTAGSTLTMSFDGTVTAGSGSGTFINQGSFIKSAGSGTMTVHTAYNNSGDVQIDSGTLNLRGNSTHTGSLDLAAGTTVSFGTTNGGLNTHQFNASSSITGVAGSQIFADYNSVVNISGTVNTLGSVLISGTGAGSIRAEMNFHQNASLGSLSMPNEAILGGNGNVTVSGPVTLSVGGGAGTLIQGTGQLNANGGLAFTNGGVQVNDRTINNAATATTAGTLGIGLNSAAVLNNLSTGTWTENGTGGYVGGTFNNAGTHIKASTGTSTVTSVYNNTGITRVNAGTMTLSSVSQHIASNLTGGTWEVNNGASLNFSTGSNITTIGTNAKVTLDGAGSSFAKINTVTNNQGEFTLKNDRDFTTAGAYANSGTTRVEDSTTVMTIGTGGASAYTQSGPSSFTILSGGAMIDTSAFNLNGGALRGTGTIDAPLTATSGNATTIAPGASPGTLTINGSTVLGNSNTLTMEVGGLAAGIDYDVLDVNGILTLGGLLDIDFINGFENSVQFFDIFTIATADSPILGSFSNVASGTSLGTNTALYFNVWYGAGSPFGANNLVLTQAPEPSRTLLLALGAASLMLRRRRRS